jgi:hypothetical protein
MHRFVDGCNDEITSFNKAVTSTKRSGEREERFRSWDDDFFDL